MTQRAFNIIAYPLPKAMVPNDNHHVAVTLAFDWEGETGGETAYEEFATKLLPNLEWGLFKLHIGSGSGVLTAMPLVEIDAPSRPLKTIRVHDWLVRRSKKSEDFWKRPSRQPANPGDQVTISSDQMNAGDALRATADWTGPVGHDLGLLRLFDLGGTLDNLTKALGNDEALVLLPYVITKPTVVKNVDAPELKEPIRFEYELGDGDKVAFGGIVLTFNGIDLSDETLELLVPDVPFVDADNGMVKLSDDPQKVAAGLARYRAFVPERHGLINPALDAVQSVDFIKLLAAVFGNEDNKAASEVIDTIASIGALMLDPLLLCLTMPTNDPVHPIEGDLLARLIDALLEAIDEALKDVDKIADETTRTAIITALTAVNDDDKLLKNLRDHIGKSQLFNGSDTKTFAAAWLDAVPAEGLVKKVVGLAGPGATAVALKDIRVPKEEETPTDFARRLTTALGNIASDLATESGLENVALRIINKLGAWKSVLPPPPPPPQPTSVDPAEVERILERTWNSAIAAFEALLTSEFDGAEAARRSVVTLFARSITLPRTDSAADGEGIKKWEDFLRSVNIDAFVKARIDGTGVAHDGSAAAETQIAVGSKLWRATTITESSPLGAALIKHDNDVTKDYIADLQSTRFVPDTRPQPLPIQLGHSADAATSELFTNHYSGIGVLLRDKGNTTKGWSSPNLAGLEWYGTEDPVYADGLKNRPFVETLQPLANDGVGAGFIGYDGIPFPSRFYDEGEVDDAAFAPLFETDTYFCDPDAPAATCDADSQTKVPELGYGITYEIAQFVVAKGGLLPEKLRDANDPWVLETADKDVFLKVHKKEIALRRRTAFSRPEIIETSGTRRLGHVPQDVLPLSLDYPREALGKDEIRDFMRDPSGRGTLSVGKEEGDERVVAIYGLRVASDAAPGATITLTLHTDPATAFDTAVANQGSDHIALFIPDFASIGGIMVRFRTFADAGGGDSTIQWRITTATGAELTKPVTASIKPFKDKDNPGDRFWLRMKCDKPLSFDVPEEKAGTGDAKADASLLLVGPKGNGLAKSLEEPATITVRHPAVTFVDFERWAANPKNLRDHPTERDRAERWLALLRRASLLRGRNERLADALNRLPDLAVDGLLLEVVPTDSLGVAVTNAEAILLVRGDLPELPPDTGFDPQKNLDALRKLQNAFDWTVNVNCADSAPRLEKVDSVTTLTTAPGTVNALRLHLAVKKDHFAPDDPKAPSDAPIDGGMRQLARRSHPKGATEYLLFRGPEFQVEAIQPGLPDAVMEQLDERIAIQPRGVSRLYDLSAVRTGTNDAKWRIVGRLDVHTQRWTPSGRPIYDFISPVPAGKTADVPIVPMKKNEKNKDRIERFEAQAFFGRPDYDENIPVPVRVPPWPAQATGEGASLLSTVSWEEPTATYFRHRFTLRSRYQGAHEAKKAQVLLKETEKVKFREHAARASWESVKDSEPTWLKRAAVLADASQLEITRPQQRAIVPAHLALDRGDGRLTMPLISTLQEAPFSVGGLADRIVADIVTGPGYHFANGATSVSIKDLRKEIGRDPRLDQSAIATGRAAGLALATEGMIGLTNDPVAASSLSFANSAVALLPTDLGGSGWEDSSETFVMTRLMRYLAPDWTFKGRLRDTDSRLPRWFEIPGTDLEDETELRQPTKIGDYKKLASLSRDDDSWSIKFNTDLIDPPAEETLGENASFRELCRVSVKDLESLILVHQPVSDVEFRLIALAKTGHKGSALSGSGNQPVLIGTITFSDSDGAFAAQPPRLVGRDGNALTAESGSVIKPRPCVFSAPTFAEWARTGKDFETLLAIVEGGEKKRIPAKRLTGRVTEQKLPGAATQRMLAFHHTLDTEAKPLWLRPEQQIVPHAQHVHRHRAGLFFAVREGLGDTSTTYLGAARLDRRDNLMGADLVEELDKFEELSSDTSIQCVVLELDAPARPVASRDDRDDGVPDSFHNFTTHLSANSNGTDLLFSGRTLGIPPETKKLEVELELKNGEATPVMTITIDTLVDWTSVVAFEITITRGNNYAAVDLIDSIGKTLFAVKNALAPGVVTRLAITAKDESEKSLAAWFDVSMHTLRETMTKTLGEWLISEDHLKGGEGDAATLRTVLDPKVLTTRHDAQSRIVAMSPAIRVKMKT